MTNDPKQTLRDYLQEARDALMWKLEGLGEYDVRRPLTPTGTNLLGLVKHLTGTELEYFGVLWDRPPAVPVPWADDETDNVDMWATADEDRDELVASYRGACAHADETIAAHDLDDGAVVPWWRPETRNTTLHRLLVHMVAETHRHAGHADIVRELVDGAAGVRAGRTNLPPGQDGVPYDWTGYLARVEDAAQTAARREDLAQNKNVF